MKKWIYVILIVVFAASVSGCGSTDWRKKFIRKQQQKTALPKYYEVKEFIPQPNLIIYKKHYVFWRSWHEELMKNIDSTGSRKRNIRCVVDAISNLKDMQARVIPEKAQKLDECMKELEDIKQKLVDETLTSSQTSGTRSRLNKMYRFIKREFSPRAITPFLLADSPEVTENYEKQKEEPQEKKGILDQILGK